MATANLNEPTSASDGNIPYIGAAADDGTGNTLREAINRINARLRELYGNQTTDGQNTVQTPFVDNDNIKDDVIKESKLNVTNAPTDGYVLTYDSATTGFTWEEKFDGDITGIVAGNGLTGDATSGDASLAVGAGTGITVNANDIQISDNGVDHDQLANRYTERTDLGAGSSFAIDFSGAAIYEVTANSNATLTFSNAKQGQVVDIITDGNHTITFAETGSTFNQVGSGTYDGSTNNLIQVVCTDDTSGSKVYHYSVGTFTSSTSA